MTTPLNTYTPPPAEQVTEWRIDPQSENFVPRWLQWSHKLFSAGWQPISGNDIDQLIAAAGRCECGAALTFAAYGREGDRLLYAVCEACNCAQEF